MCFIHENKEKKLKIIVVYVDDLILHAKTLDDMPGMKKSLSDTFRMKYMVQYYLGITFIQTKDIILLSTHFEASGEVWAV